MDFQAAKDEFLKWVIPGLLTALIYQVNSLKNEMIEQTQKQIFTEYRVDQHEASIRQLTAADNSHDVALSRISSRLGIKLSN